MIFNKVFKTFFLFVIVAIYNGAMANTKDQRIKVEIRTISHEFLMQLNDSTSRILPIEKIEGRYVVRFENEFSFEPDLLLFSVFKIYDEKDIKENFIVEVENCETKALVHSFQYSDFENKAMTPCRLRGLPKSCYVFYFTEVVDTVLLPMGNKILEDETYNTTKSSTHSYLYVFLFLLILSIGFYYYRKKYENEELQEILPSINTIDIGEYCFDKKAMTLTFNQVTTELSAKETDLLFLLYTHENKTLEREYILSQVWKNDGNYVGRTLDVFISKLRKKLEGDTQVKIINVRGVGYRFVIHKV